MRRNQFNYVDYGKTRITFLLVYEDRKNLRIDVNPDMSVVVKAPVDAAMEEIEQRVRKRARWIVTQQRFFEQFQPLQPPRRFVSGESHRYLGRQYRLKLIECDVPAVKLTRGLLTVFLPDKSDTERVRELVTDWYRNRAEIVFSQELKLLLPVIHKLQVSSPQLRIRNMKTRWGSCTKSGVIILNPELVKAPKSCIRYVLLHEICHLKEFKHSESFYKILDGVLPDWREEKRKLNLMADLLA